MKTLILLALLAALAAGLVAQTSPEPATGVPGSYQPKSPADKAHSDVEFTAIAYLHTLAYAEKLYFRKHEQYPASLAGLVGSGSFTRRMAAADRGDYTVAYRLKRDGYAVTMLPRQFDAGHRSFYLDETGQIRVEDTKRATEDSPPLK
jgi:hypothetical protein